MRRSFITSLILISLVIIPIVLSASLSFDRTPANYNLLETVNITGTGFTQNMDVILTIKNPNNGEEAVYQPTANDTGGFTISYIIPEDAISGDWTVIASGPPDISAQNSFNVAEDNENPRYSYIYHDHNVVTTLDEVVIYVKWSDDIKLGKVLIWENSTGNWVSHDVGG